MIIGAGLSGMIAAYVFSQEELFESHDQSWVEHQAVLRFRSPAVSDLTGIPFRRVTVRKGIWDVYWREPNIAVCNRYALKTIGHVTDRSIWDITTADRWVSPPDFRERVCNALGSRVHWRTPVDLASLFSTRNRDLIISTIPLSVLAPLMGDHVTFAYSSIQTTKVKIPGADVFQTVYFPSEKHRMYRASITGDELICEWASDEPLLDDEIYLAARQAEKAFGIPGLGERIVLAASGETHKQSFGKIAPIDDVVRRSLVLRLTRDYGIYSLGRFATWRNILLDDVVHDAAVIKRLVTTQTDDYARALGAH